MIGRQKNIPTMMALMAVLLVPVFARADEPVDLDFVNRLRHEAFERSQVMDLVTELTEAGPRLTGSEGMKKANEWARDRLAGWGLEKARLDPFPFGHGWQVNRVSIDVKRPFEMSMTGYAQGWTVGTRGRVKAELVRADLGSTEDLEEQKGKLKGKIVLIDELVDFDAEADDEAFLRYDHEELAALVAMDIPSGEKSTRRKRYIKRLAFRSELLEFLKEEKVVALFESSWREDAIVGVGSGGNYDKEPAGVPKLVLAAEHYNQLVRWVEAEKDVEISLDVDVKFNDAPQAYNTIAEIPGGDLADEVVMIGAHLDSWHAATGATDNAAGCAVMMEVVRLLQAMEIKPRRTIRIGLWGGEEQGLLGSREYVKQNFASRPETEDEEQLKLPSWLREKTWPLTLTDQHASFAAYFNMDNGAGMVRGIYAENNAAARPIFEAWLKPFHDLGADTVTLRDTGGTDHQSFDGVGLPGFQFVQDELDYFTKTHHTNLDTLDHVRRDDLVQASIVITSFVYHAAMRDELFPRKPMPREPDPEPESDEE
jgi:hypothetical protein